MKYWLLIAGVIAMVFMLERIAVAVERILEILEALNDPHRTPRN